MADIELGTMDKGGRDNDGYEDEDGVMESNVDDNDGMDTTIDDMVISEDEDDTTGPTAEDIVENVDTSDIIIEGTADPNADTSIIQGGIGGGLDYGESSKSYDDPLGETVIRETKQFLKDEFDISIYKDDALNSEILLGKTMVVKGKNDKIIGVMYDRRRVLVTKGGKIVYSEDVSVQDVVTEFKELLTEVQKEQQKTPAAQVEELVEAKGLGETSGEYKKSIAKATEEAIGDKISDLREKVLDNPEASGNVVRELRRQYSKDEYREIGGALSEQPVELTGDKEVDKKIVSGKIEGYEKDAEHWKKLAEKEKEGSMDRLVLELTGKIEELRADLLRLQTDQRVQSKEAVDIMEDVIEKSDLTRLERFKKWAKKNLLGISAVAISAAGLITGIVMGARAAARAGARGVSKFSKAVARVFGKLGPLFSAIGTLVSTALSWGAKGIAWLASNLWFLAIIVVYALYSEYRRRRGGNKDDNDRVE